MSEFLKDLRLRNVTPAQAVKETERSLYLCHISQEEADEVLMHYGVKGMKWGIRREVGPDGRVGGGLGRKTLNVASSSGKFVARKLKAKREEKRRDEYNKKLRAGKIDVSKMTDAELQGVLNRLNMEKQYKEVTRFLNPLPPPKNSGGSSGKSSQGKKADGFIKKAGKNVAQKQLENYLNNQFASAMNNRAASVSQKKKAKKDKGWVAVQMPKGGSGPRSSSPRPPRPPSSPPRSARAVTPKKKKVGGIKPDAIYPPGSKWK